MKRFHYSASSSIFTQRQKVEDCVDFPITDLDLSEFMVGPIDAKAPPTYDLFAVSEHIGGLGGGHYTAVAKNAQAGKWFSFNDSIVTEVQPEAAVTPKAYVLFYRRSKGSLKWGGNTASKGM